MAINYRAAQSAEQDQTACKRCLIFHGNLRKMNR